MFETPTKTYEPVPVAIEGELLTGAYHFATASLTQGELGVWIASACNEFADRSPDEQRAAINAWRAHHYEKELKELRAVDFSALPLEMAKRQRKLLAEAEVCWSEIVRALDGEQRTANPGTK